MEIKTGGSKSKFSGSPAEGDSSHRPPPPPFKSTRTGDTTGGRHATEASSSGGGEGGGAGGGRGAGGAGGKLDLAKLAAVAGAAAAKARDQTALWRQAQNLKKAKSSKAEAVRVRCVRTCEDSSILCLDYVHISICPLLLQVDELLLGKLMMFIQNLDLPELLAALDSLSSFLASASAPTEPEEVSADLLSLACLLDGFSMTLRDPMLINTSQFDDSHLAKLYLGEFKLDSIAIAVSVRVCPTDQDAGVHKLRKLLPVPLPQVENAPVDLSKFAVTHLFGEYDSAMGLIAKHCLHQGLAGLHRVLFSLETLGNPVGLVRRIGLGFSDFVNEPKQGLRQNPMAFGRGLAKGTMSLVTNTVGGLTVYAGKLTGSLGDGLAQLTFDDHYRRGRKHSDVRGMTDGLKKGAKQLGMGIFDGITGVVVAPIRGAAEGGAAGFVKGVGQGIVGVAVKPVTGLLDFAAHTSQGFKSKRQGQGVYGERVRPPRFFDDNKVVGYSRGDSEADQLFQQIGTYEREELAAHDTEAGQPERLEQHWFVVFEKTRAKRSSSALVVLTSKRLLYLVQESTRANLEALKTATKRVITMSNDLEGPGYVVKSVVFLSAITMLYAQGTVVFLKKAQAMGKSTPGFHDRSRSMNKSTGDLGLKKVQAKFGKIFKVGGGATRPTAAPPVGALRRRSGTWAGKKLIAQSQGNLRSPSRLRSPGGATTPSRLRSTTPATPPAAALPVSFPSALCQVDCGAEDVAQEVLTKTRRVLEAMRSTS